MTTIFKTIATFKHIVIKHVCYYLKSPTGGAGTVGMEWFTNSNVPVNSHSYNSQHRRWRHQVLNKICQTTCMIYENIKEDMKEVTLLR